VNFISVADEQIQNTQSRVMYARHKDSAKFSKTSKQTFIVRESFHCCTKPSARTSLHVTKLWNGFPVSLCQVTKDERCADIPIHAIWCGLTPATITHITHLQKNNQTTDLKVCQAW